MSSQQVHHNNALICFLCLIRFEEECTRVEEEDCRTVYDTVWEKKCEMVNVTVPQTACEEVFDVVMETK